MDNKKKLQKLIADLQTKKFREGEAKGLTETIGGEITKQLTPAFNGLAESLTDQMAGMFKEKVGEMKIEVPEQQLPEIVIDTEPLAEALRNVQIKVPESVVNVPEIKIPNISVPEARVVMPDSMRIDGEVDLRGVNKMAPLPVRLMDEGGKPFMFPISMGASGGKADFFTVKGFNTSAFSELQNADGRLRVSVETGGSGLTDSELRASAVPVSQVSGASWSTEATQAGTWNIGTVTTVTGVTNSIQASIIDSSGVGYSGSNPVPAIITQGGNTASIDTAGADNESNSSNRLSVRSHLSYYDGTTWDRVRGDSTDGLLVNLGANNDVVVSTIFGTTGTNVVNPDNRVKVELPATSVTIGAGSADIGSVTVNGSLNSMIATGVTLHGAVDTGDAPLKIGGVAVTTVNPTAVTGGDRVNFRADKLGRQIVRPVQVRELTTTAYTSLTTGSETTLLAGSASTFHDLIYVMGANQSDAAVTVDFRCGTAGSVVLSLQIPANGTAGIACPVPLPMPEVAQAWTADMDDITGTTVDITALFSKEI